ncbi:Uncharacterised protein [Klebsiella pneumoniae]|nr:Uncharacterised protein [Klebsiella pneumoniae]
MVNHVDSALRLNAGSAAGADVTRHAQQAGDNRGGNTCTEFRPYGTGGEDHPFLSDARFPLAEFDGIAAEAEQHGIQRGEANTANNRVCQRPVVIIRVKHKQHLADGRQHNAAEGNVAFTVFTDRH